MAEGAGPASPRPLAGSGYRSSAGGLNAGKKLLKAFGFPARPSFGWGISPVRHHENVMMGPAVIATSE
jgi:hypothetical protein